MPNVNNSALNLRGRPSTAFENDANKANNDRRLLVPVLSLTLQKLLEYPLMSGSSLEVFFGFADWCILKWLGLRS
jgi:hypothetical protein